MNCLQVLTPGISELVSALQQKDKRVYLVSGGFRQMINPVADAVNIARDNIFANSLLFGDDGAYAGFDETEPTSRAGGKAEVVVSLKAQHGRLASSLKYSRLGAGCLMPAGTAERRCLLTRVEREA